MKKIFLISILLSLVISSAVSQGYIRINSLLPDTSKLENFSFYFEQYKEVRKKQIAYNPSDEEIKSMYYCGESIVEAMQINNYREFNWYKLVSFPVKNIDIFNKVLNDSEMLFEYKYNSISSIYTQALLAKYKGKYYFSGAFNYLLESLGLNKDISVEEKIECLIKWNYWLWDQDIQMLEIKKTVEEMPYDTIIHQRISLETDERIAVNVHHDYKAKYYGRIVFQDKELEFYATIVGDKKFIKSIFLFELGTKDPLYEDNTKNWFYNIMIAYSNYNYGDRSEDRSNTIFLYLDGTNTALQGVTQEESPNNCVAYYYPDNSNDNYTLHLSGDLATSYPMQIKLCRVTGATVNENIDVWKSEKISPYFNNGFDISNKVSSGFYVVKFMFASNNWQFLNLLELS